MVDFTAVRKMTVAQRILALLSVVTTVGCGALLSTSESDPPIPNPSGNGGNGVDATDGGASESTTADGATTRLCPWDARFGEPKPLTELNTNANEADPHLANNELTIYFTRNDQFGNAHIKTARRSSVAEPFGNPEEIDLRPGNVVGQAAVSEDDQFMVFSSIFGVAPLPVQWDLYTARRPAPGAPWSLVGAFVRTAGNDETPYVSADTIYYSSGDRLFSASNLGGGAPIELTLPGLLSPRNPVVSADQLTMWFTDRFDNLQVTHRNAVTEPFGAAKPLDELNTLSTEIAGYISRDQCRFYFARGVGFPNQVDLFVASR